MISTEETRQRATDVETQIRLHPESHDQKRWIDECKSTACVAGWTVIQAGYTEVVYESDIQRSLQCGYKIIADGYVTEIEYVASSLLGLTELEMDWLFSEFRSRQEVLDGLVAVREGDSEKLGELILATQEQEIFEQEQERMSYGER